jgi:hypothetical protein
MIEGPAIRIPLKEKEPETRRIPPSPLSHYEKKESCQFRKVKKGRKRKERQTSLGQPRQASRGFGHGS